MAERRRLNGDPVGRDVPERLKPVRVHVEIEYRQDRNGATRTRYGKTYQDDASNVATRRYVVVLTSEALDPLQGPKMIVTTVAQQLYRRLTWEGWPRQERGTVVDVRPGGEGYEL